MLPVLAVLIRAEAVGAGLEDREGFDVSLPLRSIRAPGSERNRHFDASIVCGLLDTCTACKNDEVGERDLLTVLLRAVEVALNLLESTEDVRELLRFVGFPALLRFQSNASAVRASALI